MTHEDTASNAHSAATGVLPTDLSRAELYELLRRIWLTSVRHKCGALSGYVMSVQTFTELGRAVRGTGVADAADTNALPPPPARPSRSKA